MAGNLGAHYRLARLRFVGPFDQTTLSLKQSRDKRA
jgi:hypothetical protein